ncbi:MAG TPA: SCP2 sterol-binding domain-containing protein [Terriglobales bacterium]
MSETTMSAQEFLTDIVKKIESRSEKFAGINWVLGYDFSASNDGIWHIVIEDGQASGPFEGENPECIITTIGPLPLVIEESKHRFNPMTAMWNTGKLRFHGDAMTAHKFAKLLA